MRKTSAESNTRPQSRHLYSIPSSLSSWPLHSGQSDPARPDMPPRRRHASIGVSSPARRSERSAARTQWVRAGSNYSETCSRPMVAVRVSQNSNPESISCRWLLATLVAWRQEMGPGGFEPEPDGRLPPVGTASGRVRTAGRFCPLTRKSRDAHGVRVARRDSSADCSGSGRVRTGGRRTHSLRSLARLPGFDPAGTCDSLVTSVPRRIAWVRAGSNHRSRPCKGRVIATRPRTRGRRKSARVVNAYLPRRRKV